MELNSMGNPPARRSGDRAATAMEAHLGYWLRLVSNEVSRAFANAMHEQGMSVAEWVAMNQLGAASALTPATLASAMGMTRGAISKILEKLASKRLIIRSISPADSRVQLLSLTERARRILPQLTVIADGNDAHYFAALDSEEKATLQRLLRKIAGIHQMTRIPVE